MNLQGCFDWAASTLSSLISPRPSHAGDTEDVVLKNLDTTMRRIRALIHDYEKPRSEPMMHTEQLRLKELKDVAYDAEDVLDEYAYLVKKTRIQALHEAGSSRRRRRDEVDEQVLDQLAFMRPVTVPVPEELEDKVKEILEEFDHINNQWDSLQLRVTDGDMRSGVSDMEIVPTSSLLCEADIVGRMDDKEKVIEMIFAENAGLCPVSVLPIVGMTGIGKTTLAQLVYNDPRVHEGFDLKGWVFLGGNFNVKALTKKIIDTFTCKNCDLTELNELHKTLEEMVRGKTFFLVLDDVSNDTTGAWSTLLGPMISAKSGRIVVTAHDNQVAKIKNSRPFYSLGYLPDEDCWSLFKKLVCPRSELLEIGRSIVDKCNGLPLAVKAIGIALSFENDEETWKNILESGLWELAESRGAMFPALRLSYDRMPIHLKQCFVFFSLFPKGHVFSNDKVVRLWMSLGLLEESREKEQLGRKYINELLQFSMIQNRQAMGAFSLHDIVHSVAESVAGEDFVIVDEDLVTKINDEMFTMEYRTLNTMKKKRYLAMIRRFTSSIGFQILSEINKLRIVQVIQFSSTQAPTQKNKLLRFSEPHITRIPNELFQHLTHLRNLDFSNTLINTLPESIGNLIQLRSLVLTDTCIEKLPETICFLYCLQTLDLMGCPVQELPKGIKNLVKLRHLIFENSNYICMPRGIGWLKDLRTLPRFDVGKGSWHCELSELNELANLEGELCIGGLENGGIEKGDLVGIVIVSKKINVLRLDWSSGEPGQCEHDIVGTCTETTSGLTASNQPLDNVATGLHDHVFKMLRPNSALKELHIHKYCGSEFPRWLGAAYFTRLVKISLVDMEHCTRLPLLGQLPSLKTLCIQSLWGVKSIGREFCWCDGPGFPALEYLEFLDMINWVEWCEVGNNDFTSLKTLKILCSPILQNLPRFLSSSLTKLVILDCDKLTCLPNLPSLKSLSLKGGIKESMFSLLDLPSLRTLKVCYSSNIRSLSFNGSKLMSLEVLVIHSCQNLESVSGFSNFKSLKFFKICKCQEVKFSYTEEIPPSVRNLDISDCHMLQGWELFHKNKLMVQLNNDGGADDEELKALAELSEAEN
ncbi:hypothetical protein LUZ60_004948 [Juncus effusus]|nr:hypothetical protein LUZ60_004948 [Juncus effusus]